MRDAEDVSVFNDAMRVLSFSRSFGSGPWHRDRGTGGAFYVADCGALLGSTTIGSGLVLPVAVQPSPRKYPTIVTCQKLPAQTLLTLP
jgi:hypothetical protein